MANRSPTGASGSFPHPGLVMRAHFAGGSRNPLQVCRLPQRLLQTVPSGHPVFRISVHIGGAEGRLSLSWETAHLPGEGDI